MAKLTKLSLYVAGQTPKSKAAIKKLEALCSDELNSRFVVDVIDLQKSPHLARENGIAAIPKLTHRLPVSIRKIIGELADTHKVLVALDYQ